MAIGRPPKTNEQKRKTGNPGGRTLTPIAKVISLPAVSPGAPGHLQNPGLALWIQLMDRATWIAESDRTSLILLCERYDRRAEMIAQLENNLVLTTDKGYKYPNPLVGMLTSLEVEIMKQMSLMGLTPADRTRLALGEVTTQSKLAELRNKKAAK
jgi:P27 family predicted phage terminase small subunit